MSSVYVECSFVSGLKDKVKQASKRYIILQTAIEISRLMKQDLTTIPRLDEFFAEHYNTGVWA